MAQIYYVRSSTGRIKLSKGRRQREKGEIDMHAASEQRMQLNWKCRIFILNSTYVDRSMLIQVWEKMIEHTHSLEI